MSDLTKVHCPGTFDHSDLTYTYMYVQAFKSKFLGTRSPDTLILQIYACNNGTTLALDFLSLNILTLFR